MYRMRYISQLESLNFAIEKLIINFSSSSNLKIPLAYSIMPVAHDITTSSSSSLVGY